jgi:hypothetical protein
MIKFTFTICEKAWLTSNLRGTNAIFSLVSAGDKGKVVFVLQYYDV